MNLFQRGKVSSYFVIHFLRSKGLASMSCEEKGLDRKVTLNDGHKIPLFGLGVYNALGDTCREAVKFALQNGYQLIDTAAFYKNESEVGEAIKESGVKREDIYVVTKLSYAHGYDECLQAFHESLKKPGNFFVDMRCSGLTQPVKVKDIRTVRRIFCSPRADRLDTGYVDLYLIHSPTAGKNIDSYKAMLKLKDQGLIRSVGVSNFGVHHLNEMEKAGLPTPAVNQIELNPFWRLDDIVNCCVEKGIVPMGYCPLFRGQKNGDPTLIEIANKYGKTVPQVLLRWSLQKNYVTIPKTSRKERIIENADVFDFVLSEGDMKILDNMPTEQCALLGNVVEAPWKG